MVIISEIKKPKWLKVKLPTGEAFKNVSAVFNEIKEFKEAMKKAVNVPVYNVMNKEEEYV